MQACTGEEFYREEANENSSLISENNMKNIENKNPNENNNLFSKKDCKINFSYTLIS